MNIQIKEIENKKYIELVSTANPLGSEQDALDCIGLCFEHETNLVMIHYSALSEDFFRLQTKVAGDILQKFINYNIKTVAIIPNEVMQKGRFREMALETNKGHHFRMYEDKEEAEQWLLAQ
jgi:PadR family transcriptional regulator, regulatory protein AphA